MMVLLVQLASAQDWPGGAAYQPEELNADPFRPALDPGALLATESAQVPEQLTVRADLTEVHNPLVWISEDGDQVNLIGDALGLHLGGSLGLGRARVAISAPLLRLFESGAHEVPSVMAGDLALSGKVAIKSGDGLRLAALGGVILPLGADAYQLGYSGLSGDLGLAVGGGDDLRWLANLGYRIQPVTELDNEAGLLTLDDPLMLRGGLAVPLSEHAALTGELLASLTPSAFAVESTPVEGMVGAQHRTREGRILRGGVGVGIIAGIGAPTFRLMIGIGHDPGAPPVLVPEDALPDADPATEPAEASPAGESPTGESPPAP